MKEKTILTIKEDNTMTTLKKYTLTDLKEKKIAVKLRNYEEYKRLCDSVGDKDDEELFFIEDRYYGFMYSNNGIYIIDDVELPNYILLDSIDEIDLEEKEDERKPINKVAELIGEASMCWSETPKGVFDSTRTSEIVDKIEAIYNEQIARLKEENEELKDHVTNLKNANGAFAEKILKQKEEIQQLESTNQSERTRMAWELYTKYNKCDWSTKDCIEIVDSFLAKAKEGGNG